MKDNGRQLFLQSFGDQAGGTGGGGGSEGSGGGGGGGGAGAPGGDGGSVLSTTYNISVPPAFLEWLVAEFPELSAEYDDRADDDTKRRWLDRVANTLVASGLQMPATVGAQLIVAALK